MNNTEITPAVEVINLDNCNRIAIENYTEYDSGKSGAWITVYNFCLQNGMKPNEINEVPRNLSGIENVIHFFSKAIAASQHTPTEDTEGQEVLWKEVAKEFRFDKPFHESVVKDIVQRLTGKGFIISKNGYATTPALTKEVKNISQQGEQC